ncbi:short chain dehydrogenase/ reductase [Microdochium bolleyi]|uniref:Short chain dehydrogenase/ reductase n=1 Tax=Microdochium bolleyi TaxID=196109 RepID=A0A136IKM6_9PEZI|nr:short chain dehydrogenase/ reductase [Microdochium bolleyi]
MPIQFLAAVAHEGLPTWVPNSLRDPWRNVTVLVSLVVLLFIKRYLNGFLNPATRDMHGRVIIMTGATSGIGAAAARDLARRGAQLVLLTRLPPSNPFLADYIGELRETTNNNLIYAEQVDLTSLHSIRQFATKWIDNAPPRRLDMIILCADTLTPPGSKRVQTAEGIEETWMVNFLANFHLLGILSPGIRAQPFDRDVRVIIPTCSSYIGAPSLSEELDKNKWSPGKAYGRSKLAMLVFGQAFQKHLATYKRPDGLPMTSRVIFVDPGLCRTPGMRRWLSRGTLWGLFCYVGLYFVPWFFLKSAEMGAQSILYAVLESSMVRGEGGQLIKECQMVDFARTDIKDEGIAKKLWEASDKLIEQTEKEQAALRNLEKKDQEAKEKQKKEAEQAEEIEALVDAIKKGKEAEKKPSRRKNKK